LEHRLGKDLNDGISYVIAEDWQSTLTDTPQGLRLKPKKRTIVIVVVTVFVVTLSVTAIVLLNEAHQRDVYNREHTWSSLSRTLIPGGVKIVFPPLSKKVAWGDVSMLLTDGTNTKEWKPLTTDLNNGTAANWVGGSQMLGSLKVFLNVTDLTGNGYVNQGDCFTLTVGGGVFSTTATYTITIMDIPLAAAICHIDFQG